MNMGPEEIRLIINIMFLVFIAFVVFLIITRVRIIINYNVDGALPDINDIDENARPVVDDNLKTGG
jgi:preprotein translocase subunit SecY